MQYKSEGEFVRAVLSGEVNLAIDNVTSLRALIDGGELRKWRTVADTAGIKVD